MPNLPLSRRHRDTPPPKPTGHRCAHCRADLSLVRRHLSPPRLGPTTTVEFYMCGVCDSGYALNVDTGKWKPWAVDD